MNKIFYFLLFLCFLGIGITILYLPNNPSSSPSTSVNKVETEQPKIVLPPEAPCKTESPPSFCKPEEKTTNVPRNSGYNDQEMLRDGKLYKEYSLALAKQLIMALSAEDEEKIFNREFSFTEFKEKLNNKDNVITEDFNYKNNTWYKDSVSFQVDQLRQAIFSILPTDWLSYQLIYNNHPVPGIDAPQFLAALLLHLEENHYYFSENDLVDPSAEKYLFLKNWNKINLELYNYSIILLHSFGEYSSKDSSPQRILKNKDTLAGIENGEYSLGKEKEKESKQEEENNKEIESNKENNKELNKPSEEKQQ